MEYVPKRDISTRIDSLDGLRAMAIILVLLYHLTPGHNSDKGLESIIFKIADIGWSGVDLFFVLSGFLITRILLHNKQENKSIRSFFMRRILRIVPVYYFVLLFFFIVFPLITKLYRFPPFTFQIPLWGYFANYYLSPNDSLNGYFKIGHFWSLSVEMQFYLAWPFIIRYCNLDTIKKMIIILLCCTLIIRSLLVINGDDTSIAFAWTPVRMDGLIIGSLIAVGFYKGFDYRKFNKAFLCLLFLLGSFIFMITWFHYANSIFKTARSIDFIIIKILLPFILNLFFGVLLISSLNNNFLSKPFSAKPLRFLAKYSYGIYIFHFLILPLFNTYFSVSSFKNFIGENDLAIYLYFLVSSTISVLLAMFSYHLLERHFLNLKYKF